MGMYMSYSNDSIYGSVICGSANVNVQFTFTFDRKIPLPP